MGVSQTRRMGLAVSPEDVTAYQRDGAVLIKGVLPGAELELLERGLEQIHGTPTEMFSRFEAPDGRGETMADHFQACTAFPAPVAQRSPVAELAARLMGASSDSWFSTRCFTSAKG